MLLNIWIENAIGVKSVLLLAINFSFAEVYYNI